MFNKQLGQITYSDKESKDIGILFSKIEEDNPSSLRKIYADNLTRTDDFNFKQKFEIVRIGVKLGAHQEAHWGVIPSLFGDLLIVQTSHGICGMAFCNLYGIQRTLDILSKKWEGKLINNNDATFKLALKIFSGSHTIPIHLLGTKFQVDVWKSLIEIPYAKLETYSFVATNVGRKDAVRAVASAIGLNPISWLIPCHRIISKAFYLSGYNWGLNQKINLLSHEFAISPKRLFDLQCCCLRRHCELNKDKYG